MGTVVSTSQPTDYLRWGARAIIRSVYRRSPSLASWGAGQLQGIPCSHVEYGNEAIHGPIGRLAFLSRANREIGVPYSHAEHGNEGGYLHFLY